METPIKYELAVFPMSSIVLEQPLFVQVTRANGGLKRGLQVYITAVHETGKVAILGGKQLYPMDCFTLLLNPTVGANSCHDGGEGQTSDLVDLAARTGDNDAIRDNLETLIASTPELTPTRTSGSKTK